MDWPSICRKRLRAGCGLAALLLLGAACELPRDNPLDPRNPDSRRPKRILIEAFVNMHTGEPFDQYAIEALDSLESVYGDRIAVIEYHRNAGSFITPLHRSENDILYGRYLEAAGSDNRGVPDVFVDGPEGRSQGASSATSVFIRVQRMLLPELTEPGLFSIEAVLRRSGSEIRPTATIARLGSSDASGIRVRAVLLSGAEAAPAGRVASGFSESAVIGTLGAGETRTVALPAMACDPASVRACVILVFNDADQRVMQSEKFQIQ
ncbi:hypothetical protein JW777_03695 [bacterium]|nr:hypothetical protein [bacterium]